MTEQPPQIDWANLALPDTWPDRLDLRSPRSIARLLWHLLRRRDVSIPSNLLGRDIIPSYVLQEFHNLPNGNYSNGFTRGYIAGFDALMLGAMRHLRESIATSLAGCDSVLDLGCGGGATAAAIRARGAGDVWGLDPSPYLLRHAALDHPDIGFVQGVMEDLPFPDERFDAVCACFVFHEVPPGRIRQALGEIARVLQPGGLLTIVEPSPVQWRTPFLRMIRKHGWRGGYYRALVRLVHEPYLGAWHEFPLAAEARSAGLDIVYEHEAFPARCALLRRKPGTEIGDRSEFRQPKFGPVPNFS